MDSLITAAGRALAAGDPLGALKRIALRDDAPALALRGIAMAQLGDLARAKILLRRAARAFGPREAVARARCTVAAAEIALVSRDLSWPEKTLDTARTTLEAHGDHANAAHARHLEIRRLVVIGRLGDAEERLAELEPAPLPPALRCAHELVIAGIAIRRLQTKTARTALVRAARAARDAGIPALGAEVECTSVVLDTPAARMIACGHVVRNAHITVPLATRPVLFALARALAEAWPEGVPRSTLLARAFGARHVDASHRARLRVEIGRLRARVRPLADIRASREGFALVPRRGSDVVVLAPPVEDQHASVLALLADGESWPSSALAIAIGASPRTVQRALDSLAAAGKAQAVGRGRARRWMTPPVPGFPTTLLLPGPLPND